MTRRHPFRIYQPPHDDGVPGVPMVRDGLPSWWLVGLLMALTLSALVIAFRMR